MEEYNVTFIHPITGATLNAQVNPDITVNEVIEALIVENFINSPRRFTKYILEISGGDIIEGRASLISGGLKDGDIVDVVEAYGVITQYDLTFVHPSNGTELEVTINPFLSTTEIISILIAAKFIVPLDLQSFYQFEDSSGNIIKVSPSTHFDLDYVKNGDVLKIKRATFYNITFVHPISGATLTARIVPDSTVDEIINRLIAEVFIDSPSLYYTYELRKADGSVMQRHQSLEFCNLKSDDILDVILDAYNITFMHPTTKASIEMQFNPYTTIGEVLDTLYIVKFIERPNSSQNPILEISDLNEIKEEQTLKSVGIKNGSTINIIFK